MGEGGRGGRFLEYMHSMASANLHSGEQEAGL